VQSLIVETVAMSCSRDSDMHIRVAAGESLEAESFVLRSFSDCARNLPPAAEEWDVSGLLLDGQPFSRDTVACWLSCVYSTVEGIQELTAQDIQQLSTVTGLTQLLAFADAVGSRPSLYRVACSQLPQLQFVVQPSECASKLEMPVGGCTYCFEKKPAADADTAQLVRYSLQRVVVVPKSCGDASCPLQFLTSEQRRDVRQQAAQQLSALLRVAHVLRLQPLLDVLHQFIMLNFQPDKGPIASTSQFSRAVHKGGLLAGVKHLVHICSVAGSTGQQLQQWQQCSIEQQ
jgi:hypothetical protein